jgi:hypothetical protein
MTDLRKAAEMALEALETLWDILDDIDTASDMAKENDAWYRKRVEALQKKRWDTMITTDGYKLKGGPVEALRQALAQTEQEPVGYINGMHGGYMVFTPINPSAVYLNGTALYTAPPKQEYQYEVVAEHANGTYTTKRIPKREWVGLTDYEIESELTKEFGQWWSRHVSVCRAIEAKLKEKNGG